MEKLISIIVPCYNVEKYIDRCVNSLVGQTLGVDRLEIILVDDCSTDHTWECLVAIEQRYPESVAIVHCDENGRQGRARNIGLQYASAPYISFIDSDDWVELDMFEKMYAKSCQTNADIVMCDYWRDFDSADQKLPPKRDPGKQDRNLLIDTVDKRKLFFAGSIMEFSACYKLYKAELIFDNQLCFPEKLAYEDHYFATLLYFYAKKVYILEERFYHYYVNPNSTVMTGNSSHHFDILNVDTLLWDECEKRGLLEDYREEMEYQFLSLCYLTSVKMLLLRMQTVPYDFFVQLKSEVLKRVPEYRTNKYVKELVTDLYKIVLELLDKDLSEAELDTIFHSLYDYVKSGQLKM